MGRSLWPPTDIRRGERFIADTYHSLAKAGYLDNTVLVITFDIMDMPMTYIDCPAWIDDVGAFSCGLPASVRSRPIVESTK